MGRIIVWAGSGEERKKKLQQKCKESIHKKFWRGRKHSKYRERCRAKGFSGKRQMKQSCPYQRVDGETYARSPSMNARLCPERAACLTPVKGHLGRPHRHIRGGASLPGQHAAPVIRLKVGTVNRWKISFRVNIKSA